MTAILWQPWWTSCASPSVAGGAVLCEDTGAIASVKPPPATPKCDPFDASAAHLEALLTTLCVLVVPASPLEPCGDFGHPLGSGPVFAAVDLVKPGQPVLA